MGRVQTVELANMCMVYDNNGNILVQLRTKHDWPGLTFPGGHVEINEPHEHAIIREIKEETGLNIVKPVFCGIYEWFLEKDVRYIGYLYKCNTYSGTLKSSNEGEVFWIKESDLNKYPHSLDFNELYKIIKER